MNYTYSIIYYKSISQIHNDQIASKLTYINIINKYSLNTHFNSIDIEEIENILKVIQASVEYFIALLFHHFRESNTSFISLDSNINIEVFK